MHSVVPLKVHYYGTPVVLVSSTNPDGTTNLAPMSSAWWLGQEAMLGLGASSRTTQNLLRTRECVLNLAPSSTWSTTSTGSRCSPARRSSREHKREPPDTATSRASSRPPG